MLLFKEIVTFIYNYCTDFIINVANLTHLSYYECNFILFCVLFPFLTITLSCYLIYLKIKLKYLKLNFKQ